MKLVVLEGCNSEWSQDYYLPLLAKKAKEGIIQLLAVDIKPQIKLASLKTAGLWRDAKNKDNAGYLNKNDNIKTINRIADAFEVILIAES